MNKEIKKLLFVFIMMGIILIYLSGVVAADRPLRISSGWPAFLDPAVGSDMTAGKLLVNCYDTLVFPDKNTGMPKSFLAKSWNVTDDGMSWTFELHEGIKFHDGTELTADDVKFSMDRLLTIGEGFAFLFLGRVKNTEVIDDYTVVFNLEKPVGPFLDMLQRLYVLNKDLVLKNIKQPGPYGEMGNYGKDWLNAHDAGSGPYIVKEYLSEESVTMVINPNYWKPINPLAPDEYIVYNVTEPMTVRTMLERREMEIGYHQNPREVLESMEKIEGVSIKNIPQNGQMYYMLNTKKAPTDCVHFRKAMAYGQDYEAIIKDIVRGVNRSRGPIPKAAPGYDPTVKEYYFDLEKAREELEKSIYYDKLDEYPVTVYWVDRVIDMEKMTLLLMSNLAKIGIKIVPIKVPWTKIVEDSSKIETSPNVMTVWVNGDYLEPGGLLECRYKSEAAPTWSQNEWLLDPELDARINDAVSTIDTEERFAKYSEIVHYINDDLCPSISLHDAALNVPYQSAYVDWTLGESLTLMGYEFYLPDIKLYPEKREELLKK